MQGTLSSALARAARPEHRHEVPEQVGRLHPNPRELQLLIEEHYGKTPVLHYFREMANEITLLSSKLRGIDSHYQSTISGKEIDDNL